MKCNNIFDRSQKYITLKLTMRRPVLTQPVLLFDCRRPNNGCHRRLFDGQRCPHCLHVVDATLEVNTHRCVCRQPGKLSNTVDYQIRSCVYRIERTACAWASITDMNICSSAHRLPACMFLMKIDLIRRALSLSSCDRLSNNER